MPTVYVRCQKRQVSLHALHLLSAIIPQLHLPRPLWFRVFQPAVRPVVTAVSSVCLQVSGYHLRERYQVRPTDGIPTRHRSNHETRRGRDASGADSQQSGPFWCQEQGTGIGMGSGCASGALSQQDPIMI